MQHTELLCHMTASHQSTCTVDTLLLDPHIIDACCTHMHSVNSVNALLSTSRPQVLAGFFCGQYVMSTRVNLLGNRQTPAPVWVLKGTLGVVAASCVTKATASHLQPQLLPLLQLQLSQGRLKSLQVP